MPSQAVESAAIKGDQEERILVASQWQLMWWRFRKHKLAIASAIVLLVLYSGVAFCEFLAPHDPTEPLSAYTLAPPQLIRFFDSQGRFHLRPFVYGYNRETDPDTLRRIYTPNTEEIHPLQLLVRGNEYEVLGLYQANLHLVGIDDGVPFFVLGTDRMGRDVLSRVLYGSRLSLTVGLVGVLLSFVLGILIGGFSGYLGGVFDAIAQRVIEFLRSVPTLPLWMGLSAAVPVNWPVVKTYFAITVVLSVVGWTGLARVVRSRFLALREEDFITSARLIGASELRIILRHLVPSFMSYLIASLTLSIPGMILGETSLSFLGLGLRPPAISWGVMLQEAQNVRSVALAPWTLLPSLFVVVTILSFNFIGDGLRDAADPYAR